MGTLNSLYPAVTSDTNANAYYVKLKGLIKSSENMKLYKQLGTAKSFTGTIPAYKDSGGPAIGFGTHYITEGAWAKVNGNIVLGTSTVTMNWVISNATGTSYGSATALEQVSMMSDKILIAYTVGLYTKIASKYPEWLKTLTDHEFCAMLDFAYNMSYGTSWITNTEKCPTLISAIKAHQASKLENKAEATILTLRQNVVKAFLLYCKADGETQLGLLKRRKKDGEMYVGSTTYKYDDDVGGTVDSILSEYGISAASLVTVTLSTDNAARVAAATKAANASAGSVYSSQIDEALSKGDYAAAERAIANLQTDGFYKQKNQKTQTVVSTGISDKQMAAEDDNPALHITDSKAYSGLLLSERDFAGSQMSMSGSTSMPFEMGRFQHNMNNSYGSFRKYGQTTEEDLSGLSTTWFFMTRPEMCLYQNIGGSDKDSSENWSTPSYQCRDIDLIDHLKIDRDLYIYLDRHIKPYYTDTNMAFIPAFTNNFKTSSLPETKFDMNKSASTTLGVSLGIPVYNSTDTSDTEIAAQFNADSRKSIMKYIDMIFKYSKSKKEGNTIPYPKIAKHNVIDISTTIFMFVVGPDGVTIESSYRSVGVVPSVNPVTSIPLTSAGERMDTINVSFKCNTNLDARKITIIEHFNLLNRMGCSRVKALSTDPSKTYAKLAGKITTYDEAIDWYLMNRHVLDVYMDDNMKVDDWHCERFIIAVEPMQGRAEYKMIPIPRSDRLYEVLSFVVNESNKGNSIFNDIIGRTSDTSTTSFRSRINTLYMQYKLNTSKLEDQLAAADKANGGKQNTDHVLGLNNAMVRMMDRVTKSVINDLQSTPGYHTGVVIGERTFGNTAANTMMVKNSAEWVMNMFRETPLDYQLASNNMRPPITSLFTNDAGTEISYGPGFGELAKLILNSKSRTGNDLHSAVTTNTKDLQMAAIASVHGGPVNYQVMNDKGEGLSATYNMKIQDIVDGDNEWITMLDKSSKTWHWESFNLTTAVSGTSLVATSNVYKAYKVLSPTISSEEYTNPLQDGTTAAIISDSGIFVMPDPSGIDPMTDFENKASKLMTDTSVKGMNRMNHKVTDSGSDTDSKNTIVIQPKSGETYANGTSSAFLEGIRSQIMSGISVLHDSGILDLALNSHESKSSIYTNVTDLDSDNLIRTYWANSKSKEWTKADGTVDSDKRETIMNQSPVDMTIEIVKDALEGASEPNFSSYVPIPGRHQPYLFMDGGRLNVYRSKAKIRYIDSKSKLLSTIETDTKMLTSILDNSYPDSDTSKAYYSLDEDGTLDQSTHQVISLFDKSVLIPSMNYGMLKDFYMNTAVSSNVKGISHSSDSATKFITFERWGDPYKIHLNAMDSYYMTPIIGNSQARFSKDGLYFPTSEAQSLAQGSFINDPSMTDSARMFTASEKKGFLLPLYDDLLPDYFDGTAITGKNNNGYEKSYFSHFLDNGLEVSPDIVKYTKTPFIGNIYWESVAKNLWAKAKGIAFQYVLDAAFDLLDNFVAKLTYDPLKFGDESVVQGLKDITVTYEEPVFTGDYYIPNPVDISNDSVQAPNIDLTELNKDLNLKVVDFVGTVESSEVYSADDMIGTYIEPNIIADDISSTASYVSETVTIQEIDVSNVHKDMIVNDIEMLTTKEEITSLEVVEVKDTSGTDVTMVSATDVIGIVDTNTLLVTDDVGVVPVTEETSFNVVDVDTSSDVGISSMVAPDIVLSSTEDMSTQNVTEVKRVVDTLRKMNVDDVSGTTDSQEYMLEEESPNISYTELSDGTLTVPDIPVISEEITSINDLLSIVIDIPESKITLLKANSGAEVMKTVVNTIEKGSFDFFDLINVVIEFDDTKVD